MLRVLLVITSDPRTSHRPAEAIRIAAGVVVWKKVELALCLRGDAVLALGEDTETLIEEENYTRYLPSLCEAANPIYVQRGAPLLAQLGNAPLPYEQIDDSQLAALAASSTYVFRF